TSVFQTMVDPKLCEEAKRQLLAGAKPSEIYKKLGIGRDKAFRLRDELGLPKRAWTSPAVPSTKDYLNFEQNIKHRVSLLRGKAKRQNIPFEISHKDL